MTGHEQDRPGDYDYTNYVPEHFASHKGDGVKEFLSRHQETVKRLALRPGLEVIDVGGGSGELTALLAHYGCQVTYVDVSPQAVDFATALCRAALDADAFGRIRFITGDLTCEEAPVRYATLVHQFDLVLNIDVWEHLPPDRCSRLLAVLCLFVKPDGLVHIETAPNRLIADLLRGTARLLLGVKGGYKDQQIHVNEQTYWSFAKALSGQAGFRFKIDPVLHPGWVYGEAICAFGARKPGWFIEKSVLLVSRVIDALSKVPGLNRLVCHGFAARSVPDARR